MEGVIVPTTADNRIKSRLRSSARSLKSRPNLSRGNKTNRSLPRTRSFRDRQVGGFNLNKLVVENGVQKEFRSNGLAETEFVYGPFTR